MPWSKRTCRSVDKMKPSVSRRHFLKSTGVCVSVTVSGQIVTMTPAQAFEKDIPLQVLSERQALTLGALAEILVPDSKRSGIVQFIDSQLSATASDSLLMIRYLGVSAPYDRFYTSSLDSLELIANTHQRKHFASLDTEQQTKLVEQMAQAKLITWNGPPSPFFHFVLRSDAADVVYGTPKGFEKLGIPYMPHIMPPPLT